MNREISVSMGNGVEYAGQVATIVDTMLGMEDHGMMTARLTLALGAGGSHVGIGGYNYGSWSNGPTASFGLTQMVWIMKTAGVELWEKLRGRQVIALFEGNIYGKCVGIAHLTDETMVLVFKDQFEAWKEKSA